MAKAFSYFVHLYARCKGTEATLCGISVIFKADSVDAAAAGQALTVLI